MSLGFPVRAKRSTFGVTREDRAAMVNPKHALGARYANLAFWQLAGLNASAPMAWVLVASGGTRTASGEAWNSEGNDALRPTVAKTATGTYTVTFAASYPDMDGDAQPWAPTSASVSIRHGLTKPSIDWEISGSVVTVYTKADGSAADAGFHISVF